MEDEGLPTYLCLLSVTQYLLFGSLRILKRHPLQHNGSYLLHQAISTQPTVVLSQDSSKFHVPASRPSAYWLSCIALWAIQDHDTHCLCDSHSIPIIFPQLFYLVSFQSKVICPLMKGVASFWKSLSCFSISHLRHRFCLVSSSSLFLIPFHSGMSGTHMGHSGDQGLLLIFV